MIRASSQSGDTLITCHFSQGPLPPWPLPVPALRGSAGRSGRSGPDGLTRTASLPEQDSLRSEPQHGFRTSSSYSVLKEERVEEEEEEEHEEEEEQLEEEEEEGGASVSSNGRCDSTSSPEEGLRRKEGCGPRAHNSFLPSRDLGCDEEEDEDADGDNLHGYREDSSFVLHGNSNWERDGGTRSSALGYVDLDQLVDAFRCFPPSGSTTKVLIKVGHPDPDPDSSIGREDQMSCGTSGRTGGLLEPLPPVHPDSAGSGSCSPSSNSSDGVLVNFSTIYDRSNKPATPRDPSSPSDRTSRPEEGAVFLNLQPVSQPANPDRTVSPRPGGGAPRGSPRGLDSNCNLFSLEAATQGLTSPEESDLSAALPTGTNQKYYRLVTCDVPSQSPSPVWSSLTSWYEARRSPDCAKHQVVYSNGIGRLQTGDKEEPRRSSSAQSVALFDSCDGCLSVHGATSQTGQALDGKVHEDQPHCLADASQRQRSHRASGSVGRSGTIGTNTVPIQPPVVLNQNLSDATAATEEGACSWAAPAVRYSKAQRPTSLPIQPFVLLPPCEPQSQQLGSLLGHYISHRSGKSSNSHPGSGGTGNRILAHLQPSPLGNQDSSLLLPAESSLNTCSTCTPSPECFSYRPAWSHARTGHGHTCSWGPQTDLGLTHSSPKLQSLQDQDSVSPYMGSTTCNPVLNGTKPIQPRFPSPENKSCLVKVPSCHDLINLTPERTDDGTEKIHRSPIRSQSNSIFHLVCSDTPPTSRQASHTHWPRPLVSLAPPRTPIPHLQRPPAPASTSYFSSLMSRLSKAGSGHQHQQIQDSESWISPDTSYESMSLSHLQRRGRLRSVSLAVELIMAHFGSTRDPEVKMHLGNSSRSPTIGGLVLEHLCPAIQNLLEDGLRDHSLDPVFGQRRNHCWDVVEASTLTGLSTRVLHSLVSKIRRCPQLSSQCMRLRAFIMGLLNLRVLEFWLSHLQSQQDVVAAYYHSWAFLSVCQGRCQPLYQELLLVLQPLAVMPFDLSLLLEPRLQQQGSPPPPLPRSALLVTSWSPLGAGGGAGARQQSQRAGGSHLPVCPQRSPSCQGRRSETHAERSRGSPGAARSPEDLCHAPPRAQTHIDGRQEDGTGERHTGTSRGSPGLPVQEESDLRWAKLFGAAGSSSRALGASRSLGGTRPKRSRRPSEWLQLDRSQLGFLALSVWPVKLGRAQTGKH